MVILPRLNDCGGVLEKKWFVFYSVRDPRNDKMQRFKSYEGLHLHKDVASREKAAQELIKELSDKLKRGWTPFNDDKTVIYEDQLQYKTITDLYGKKRSVNTTFRLYASKYIELKKEEMLVEESTISTYASKLRIFSEWLAAKHDAIDVTAIDNKMILAFFSYLINVQNLSNNTIYDYRQILSAVFEYIKRNGKIIENPVYNIPRGHDKDLAPRPVAEFDIETFRDAISVSDPQLWMAIEFETYCFLRPGKELRLLKIRDIDFARGLINVDRFRSKTNRERHATVPRHFLLKLRNVYKLQDYDKDFFVLGNEYKPGPTCLGKNNLKNRFNTFRKRLNMPYTYKLYSWKHTGNSLALDSNISMYALRDQNGHSSVQITEIYTKNKLGTVSKEIQDNFPNLDSL